MEHQLKATSSTPALTIFLIDVSGSMSLPLGEKQRIDIVGDALKSIFMRLVALSTKGKQISPRYHLALYAYTNEVYDLLGGIKTIGEVARLGKPKLVPQVNTDTAKGFAKVEELLHNVLPTYAQCPAPVVCHLTDGEYTEADPEPVVRRIMQFKVPDGPVLVENIFISDTILAEPIADVHRWAGINGQTELGSDYARKLRAMSSPLPETYRVVMREWGYPIEPGAHMLLPGNSQELVAMGFAMSTISREASRVAS